MTITITIVGRPNVGKSTLFNKLVGRSSAIVSDIKGVTRDRKEEIGNISNMKFKLLDTAGYEESDDDLKKKMIKQTELAILTSDLCIFVVELNLISDDFLIAKILKKEGKSVILVINKCDNQEGEVFDKEYYNLGFGSAIAISAEHKLGFNLLYEKILPFYNENKDNFKSLEVNFARDKFLQIAIVGMVNVGKSTFLNRVLSEDRLISSSKAGSTRDSISIDYTYKDYKIRFVDTAGIRKKSNIRSSLEKASTFASIKSINYSQLVVIMIDSKEFINHQAISIAKIAIDEGRAVIFALNKIDLIKNVKKFIEEVKVKIRYSLAEAVDFPIIAISAKEDKSLNRVIDKAIEVYNQWNIKINTSNLNSWLRRVFDEKSPPMYKGKSVKLKYITQTKVRPPNFTIFSNYADAIKESYKRYLINSLKKNFALNLIVPRITLKQSDNPYKNIKYKKFSKK